MTKKEVDALLEAEDAAQLALNNARVAVLDLEKALKAARAAATRAIHELRRQRSLPPRAA